MRHVPFFLPLSLFLVAAAVACGGRTTDDGSAAGADDTNEGDDTADEGCSGPRPEAQAAPEGKSCNTNLDCDDGHECELVSGTGSYSCVNGHWVTSDMHWKVCRPGAGGVACTPPDPSRDSCRSDTDCGDVQRVYCDRDACVPSACTCDSTTGQWGCSADCSSACKKFDEQDHCLSAPPSHDECTDNADCFEGECVEIEGCRPSSCECVESQVDGQAVYGWTCTDDCVRPRACR